MKDLGMPKGPMHWVLKTPKNLASAGREMLMCEAEMHAQAAEWAEQFSTRLGGQYARYVQITILERPEEMLMVKEFLPSWGPNSEG